MGGQPALCCWGRRCGTACGWVAWRTCVGAKDGQAGRLAIPTSLTLSDDPFSLPMHPAPPPYTHTPHTPHTASPPSPADLSFNRLSALTSPGAEGHCSCCTLACLPRLQSLVLASNLLRAFPLCLLLGCVHGAGCGGHASQLALLDLVGNPGGVQGVLEVPWDLVRARASALTVLVSPGHAQPAPGAGAAGS